MSNKNDADASVGTQKVSRQLSMPNIHSKAFYSVFNKIPYDIKMSNLMKIYQFVKASFYEINSV